MALGIFLAQLSGELRKSFLGHVTGSLLPSSWAGRNATEIIMIQRLSLTRPNEGVQAMQDIEAGLVKAVDRGLVALVHVRVSQMNGCAYCLHMHSEEALKLGERLERLIVLDAWHESSLFTDRERAALAWAESLTR